MSAIEIATVFGVAVALFPTGVWGAVVSGIVSSGAVVSGVVSSGAVVSGVVSSGAVVSGVVSSGTVVSGVVSSGASVSVAEESPWILIIYSGVTWFSSSSFQSETVNTYKKFVPSAFSSI